MRNLFAIFFWNYSQILCNNSIIFFLIRNNAFLTSSGSLSFNFLSIWRIFHRNISLWETESFRIFDGIFVKVNWFLERGCNVESFCSITIWKLYLNLFWGRSEGFSQLFILWGLLCWYIFYFHHRFDFMNIRLIARLVLSGHWSINFLLKRFQALVYSSWSWFCINQCFFKFRLIDDHITGLRF